MAVIQRLPNEVCGTILEFLPFRDVTQLSATCTDAMKRIFALWNQSSSPGLTYSDRWLQNSWRLIDWSHPLAHQRIGHVLQRCVPFPLQGIAAVRRQVGASQGKNRSECWKAVAAAGDRALVECGLEQMLAPSVIGVSAWSDWDEPLAAAAGKGHIDIVRRILLAAERKGEGVNPHGRRMALLQAAEGGQMETVEFLLPLAPSEYGLLESAVRGGLDSIAQRCLETKGVRAEGLERGLVDAAARSNGNLFGRIEEEGFARGGVWTQAALDRMGTMVIERGAPVDLFLQLNLGGITISTGVLGHLWKQAAARCRIDLLERILEEVDRRGGEVLSPGYCCDEALTSTAYRGDIQVLEYLVQAIPHGAAVGRQALENALLEVSRGSVRGVELLLDADLCGMQVSVKALGWALHSAACSGNEERVGLILESAAEREVSLDVMDLQGTLKIAPEPIKKQILAACSLGQRLALLITWF